MFDVSFPRLSLFFDENDSALVDIHGNGLLHN